MASASSVWGVLLAPLLWLAGSVVLDGVHAALHAMLRSRSRLLRALAAPHPGPPVRPGAPATA